MNYKTVPISEVKVWKKNPRNVTKKGMERLKKQIQELGVYKPLICVRENGHYITLGGNQRLRVLQLLKHKEVDISIVKAATEALKIKYALSDNDKVAETDDQKVAELVYPHKSEIRFEDYNIDRGESISLSRMLDDFAPGGVAEQARLDQIAEKQEVKCPKCGLVFIP